jgi:cysteinyl-tRNA synthetase
MGFFARIFGIRKDGVRSRPPRIFFINTLSGKKELFISQKPGVVTIYSCGPTVYAPALIGNLRAYVFSDTIVRVLQYAKYRVRRVINITDVGHMVGDVDDGEDKMTVGAKRDKTTPEEIAERYTKMFKENLADLNVDIDEIRFPRATEYIKEQIALAVTLEEKGLTYRLSDGLYFDTKKFSGYGRLGGVASAELEPGSRVSVVKGKRSPADFVLWRSAKSGDLQQWDSPWGHGNPGWHIECSAMSRAILGQEIDIHTGGEDHIAIHHNNEIAQSEGSSGRTFVHYWMHNAFLTIAGQKVSKSLGNGFTLQDVIEKGFSPVALRYFFLQAHYRTPLSFSWDALAGAASGLARLWDMVCEVREESGKRSAPSESREHFISVMRDDLGTPQALGILWDSLKSEEYTAQEKWGLIEDADAHFGLSLLDPPKKEFVNIENLPNAVKEMLRLRSIARNKMDFNKADAIREDIERSGYHVDDGPNGPVLTKITL